MKLVNIKILAILVFSYSLSLVAMTPLSWLLPFVEGQLAPLGVKINQAEGSLWNGSAQITERTVGSVNVNWDVRLASLLLLSLPVDVEVSNAHMNVTGMVSAGFGGLKIADLEGYIDEKAAEPFYKPYRADLSGRLQLSDVSANVSWGRSLGDATGELSWSGGPISFPVGRSTQNFEVPMMLGQITSDDSAWRFDVKNTSDQQYIAATLSREGEANLSIKRVLATDMNIPIPSGGSSLFDISQQVF